MAPKKVDAPKMPLIGRFGTSLKIGVVGPPNVGQAAAENVPFCTIDPNESRVPIPDERYDFLCQFHKPPSKVPAFLNVVDIAVLMKGAHAGEGLGNAFLSHISAFEDEDIIHVEGTVDPVRDMEIIHDELRLKDEEMIGPIIDKLEKMAIRGGDKKLKPEYKIKSWVMDEKKHVHYYHDWDDKEVSLHCGSILFPMGQRNKVKLSKKKNLWLECNEWRDSHEPGALVTPFSGSLESQLQDKSEEERQKHRTEHKTQRLIIIQLYAALLLEYFFTAGPDEVHAWTIRVRASCLLLRGRSTTTFEKGFIMAEVMQFLDFKEEGSESAVKAAGKYRQQGRNYVGQDGDIIFFKLNSPNGPKKK
uniref:Obg like ATPase 1 n=1 Tax=Cyclopterus lumpus TaxID=8103 RepID=A0A8C3ARW8_CYCLU